MLAKIHGLARREPLHELHLVKAKHALRKGKFANELSQEIVLTVLTLLFFYSLHVS